MLARRLLAPLLCAAFLLLPSAAQADSEPVPGQYIVVLKHDAVLSQVVASHEATAGADVLFVYGHALNGYAARLTPLGLSVVRADPQVDYVAQDMRGDDLTQGKAKPPPPPPPPPWNTPQTLPTGIDRIDGDQSSQLSGDGQGTFGGPPVAIVDTGIDGAHPDLNVAGGVNCVGPISSANDGTYNDGMGHGTHVAGIVGAKDDAYGVVGLAPGVPLYSVRTLDANGSGTSSGQLCGVDWVTANAAALGIRVANFSQVSVLPKQDDGNCGNTNADPLHQAICRSTASGVLWVAGMGNSVVDVSTGPNQAPMGYGEVLSATAIADANGTAGGGGSIGCRTGEVDDRYASFSAYVSSPADQAHTVAEPGVCINSTWKGSTYSLQSGTSMAAPTASGTAELCIAAGACSGTPAETIQKLVGDAAAYNAANPAFGYTGDPQHSPVSGRYYGYLLRAGAY
jgi:subtilisin